MASFCGAFVVLVGNDNNKLQSHFSYKLGKGRMSASLFVNACSLTEAFAFFVALCKSGRYAHLLMSLIVYTNKLTKPGDFFLLQQGKCTKKIVCYLNYFQDVCQLEVSDY